MSPTRREFMMGCSAAIASLAGSRFNSLAFASSPGISDEILVVLFLRGGIDGHNFLPPTSHPDRGHYEIARPNLQVPASGAGGALSVGGGFGLHPSASPLYQLFQSGHLALIQACGMATTVTRSHFDAQAYLELGTPGSSKTVNGWLTRLLDNATNFPANMQIPALASGQLSPTSLRGSLESLNVGNINDFDLDQGAWDWRGAHRVALRSLIESGNRQIHQSCAQALDAVDIVELSVSGGYAPANGANYPSGTLGSNLRTIAQIIKLGLGLRVATLDFGGWDTHNGQGNGSGGYFAGHVAELAQALEAFYIDLDGSGPSAYTRRLTVVVQSEFGRRLRQNADNGSDHGYGNVMMVLGGEVNGGLYGTWPGLASGQLFDGADLDVTTDFRRVLSEIMIRRFCNPRLHQIFPGYDSTYAAEGPLGVVQGVDLPVLTENIFSDGFENGTGRWSAAG